jgi:hypothetical protein
MKILKKGGSREKGGGGNEIHAPCACGANVVNNISRNFNLSKNGQLYVKIQLLCLPFETKGDIIVLVWFFLPLLPLPLLLIWPWGQRSRSHEGHYGTRHTALWSCTHIPNIIDLSRKRIFKPMDMEWAYKKEKNHILENLFMWQKMINLILLNQAITEQCMHIYITWWFMFSILP